MKYNLEYYKMYFMSLHNQPHVHKVIGRYKMKFPFSQSGLAV